MALTNWSIIQLCNTVRNVDVQGNDMTAYEWQTLINTNSRKLFSSLLGSRKKYQINMPVEQSGAGVSRKISTQLRPFFVREVLAAPSGVLSFTGKNLAYLLAIDPASITGRGFDELEPDEVADRMGSSVVMPTVKDPVYTWSNDETVLLFPSTITSVTASYYTYPTDAVVLFTTNVTTLQPEYGAGSVETGWEDDELIEIAYMCLRDLGVNQERQDVYAHAQNMVTNEQ